MRLINDCINKILDDKTDFLSKVGYILLTYKAFLDDTYLTTKFYYEAYRENGLRKSFIESFLSYPSSIKLLEKCMGIFKLNKPDINFLSGRDIDKTIEFFSRIDFREIPYEGIFTSFLVLLNTIAYNFKNNVVFDLYNIFKENYQVFNSVAGEGFNFLLKFLSDKCMRKYFIKIYEDVLNQICVEIFSSNGFISINYLSELLKIFLLKFYRGSDDVKKLYRYFLEKLFKLRYILYILAVKHIESPDIVKTFLLKSYLKRVTYITAEDLLGKNIPLYIYVNPVREVYRKTFSIFFGTFQGFFRNALWDISQDVIEHNYQHNKNILFLGAYKDWIIFLENKVKVYRAILCREKSYLIESFLHPPVPIDFCQILNLPYENEINMHRFLSQKIGITDTIMINPYISSNICNSKYLTHRYIEKYCKVYGETIEMPRYLFLSRNTENFYELIIDILPRFPSSKIIVKPDHGTEGLDIKVFDKNDIDKITEYCRRMFEKDDVIIEEVRGNMFYNSRYPFTVRINVSYNGRRYDVEGGYGLVAKSRDYIVSSISHGGKIVEINKLLKNIYYKRVRYEISERDLLNIVKTCINVARAVNFTMNTIDSLKYMGIDLVLEYYNNAIKPVVLEVNPRPSGLTYLRKISLRKCGEVNVLKNLLKYIDC